MANQQVNIKGILSDGAAASSALLGAAAWSSNDETVAKVVGNQIKTLKKGSAIITATIDGIATSLTVIVEDAKLESLEFQKDGVKITSMNVAKGRAIDILFG